MGDTIDITVREGVAYLGTIQDTEVLEKIVEGTSFKPAGVEYTTAYRRRQSAGFDGRIKLVKHSKCPVGLLPRVINIIRDAGLDVNVIQADTAVDKSVAIETRLDGLESRFYQDDAVAVTSIFDRGVIRAPTGGGKSAIIARIIHEKKKRAIVVVPTKDLLHQFKEFLTEHLKVLDGLERVEVYNTVLGVKQNFEPIGQLGDGVVDPRGVTVATVRTMAKVLDIAYETYEYGEMDDKDDTEVNPRELREWIKSIGVLAFDEVHMVAARMAYDITNAIPAEIKYGTSASPWRDDGADLMIEAAIGPVLYRIDPKTLVDHGFLVPPIIQVIPTAQWWTAAAWGKVCKRCRRQALKWKPTCECGSSEFKSQYQEMYKAEIVENEVRNARIAEKVIVLDAPTLVLVKQISHGRRLQELIPDSVFLSGKDKGSARKDAFDAVRGGELKVLICSTIADMGLDLPLLEVLVLAGGGKSSTRHLQRIGRVVRTNLDKKSALVMDFDDSHVSTWLGKHEQERRKIERAEWAECAIWI